MSALPNIQERFQRAIDAFVDKVRHDHHVLAVVLFGSLSHDVVWAKSDIDLLLVSEDAAGKDRTRRGFALVEHDVNIHAYIMPRSEFRQMIEGSLQSDIMHSSFALSRLLFTRDETIEELYEGIDRLGTRDRRVQLFREATCVVPCLQKAEKFLRVKSDPRYASIWIGYCYSPLARIEVYEKGEIAGREVIHQALKLNPDFFGAIYTELLDRKKTKKAVGAAVDAIDDYLTERIPLLFQPLLDYLREQGTLRSSTDIEAWCEHQLGAHGGVTACEWLADKEIITKVSTPVRLTRRSQVEMEELAFLHGDPVF